MAKINLGRIKLQFQGEYDKNQSYRRDDIVYHNNAMWILTNEYMPDGTNAFAPGTKIFGYNPKEMNGWINDPNFTNTDFFGYTQYWTENERGDEKQRTDVDGNPITRHSTNFSNEHEAIHAHHSTIDASMGSIVRHQKHLFEEYDEMFQMTEDDYSELDNFNGYEQNYFRYHYVPTDNNFVVSVQVSGGVPDFKIDNRMGHNTKGRQFAGYKNWEFFKEGHTYRFHQHNNSNKYYPLGFSYTADGIHNTNNTGKSLGEDPRGPYYVKGTASNGDNGFFFPMYKDEEAANAEDTRRGGAGSSRKVTFNQGDVPGWETEASPSLKGMLDSSGNQLKDTVVSLLTDDSNNTYLQVTNAWAGTAGAGASVSTRRTIYISSADSAEYPTETGSTVAPVYIQGALKVGANITATITQGRDNFVAAGTPAPSEHAAAGKKILLVNGKPVYQLVAESTTTSVGGITGNFTAVDKTGTSTNTALGSNPTSNEGLIELYMPDTTDPTENTERTFQISVSNPGSGNKFYVDGVLAADNVVKFEEGKTYLFDQSNSTNSGHTLAFSTTADGTHGGGSELTAGVTYVGTPGNPGAHTKINVRKATAKLYIYCKAHAGMYNSKSVETYDMANNQARTYAPTNIKKWRGYGKNGWVKYYLNNRQVDENTYIDSFFNADRDYNRNYPKKMRNGKTLGFESGYNFVNKESRTVEILIPYAQNDYERSTNTIIYPFCLEPTTSNRNTTGMYNSLGWTIEKTWRGHKHWDKVQSSMRFRGEYSPNTHYNYNDVVSYKEFKRISTGEKHYFMGTGLYRALRDNKGRPPQYGFQEPTRSPMMTKTTTTSGRLTGYSEHEQNNETGKNYPAHIQSYHNCWESFAGMNSQEQCAGVWFPNRGPMNWPYKHGNSEFACVYRSQTYIDKNGAIWTLGHGTNSSNGEQGRSSSYFREMTFRWRDFYNSENRNEGGYEERRSGKWTRYDRQRTPRCIQIEEGYGFKLILFDNGQVFHTGYGSHGQQGTGYDGSPGMAISPAGLEDVFAVKLAQKHGNEDDTHTPAILDDNGDVWVWGYNGYGECGDGRTQNCYGPKRIPREWFNDEKIIDITCSGGDSTSFYVRTSEDNIYAWGRNNVGQLGDTTTTDKYRPVKMSGFAAADNGGIAVWQCNSHSSNSNFSILDGNGYIWATGYNGYGNFVDNSTTNRNQLTQSTATPNEDIVDFWTLYWNGYHTTFMRLKNGQTWTAGHSGGYYLSGDGGTGTNQAPVQVDKVNNLKEVSIVCSHSDVGRLYMLQDNGEFFAQGYSSYGGLANPIAGTNWTGEDGTYKPFHTYIPAGTRIRTMYAKGTDNSSNYYSPQMMVGTDDGQVLLWGYSNNNNLGHHATATWSSTGRALMWNAGVGR